MPRRRPARSKLSRLQAKLATGIVEYAQRMELAKGAHLAEETLAQEFGVSRSPVRTTLFYLEKRGMIEFRANYGFFLAAAASELDTSGLQIPQDEEQKLYDAITRDQLKGALHEGAMEAELMRRYRVNRGRLSRVLARLSREGIAQRSHGHGWTFLPTFNSEASHDESYNFRAVVEPAGLLQPTFAIDAKRMQRVRQAHEEIVKNRGRKITDVEMFEINAEFHEMLAAFSGNRFILQAAEQQNRLRRMIEHRNMTPERAVESCQEHLAIMDSLDKGDREWAATLLRRHLEQAKQLSWPSHLVTPK
jgi:DNA-binding GntR family transcriptional regulator